MTDAAPEDKVQENSKIFLLLLFFNHSCCFVFSERISEKSYFLFLHESYSIFKMSSNYTSGGINY